MSGKQNLAVGREGGELRAVIVAKAGEEDLIVDADGKAALGEGVLVVGGGRAGPFFSRVAFPGKSNRLPACCGSDLSVPILPSLLSAAWCVGNAREMARTTCGELREAVSVDSGATGGFVVCGRLKQIVELRGSVGQLV